MDTRATTTAQQMVDELPGLNPARSLRHEATEGSATTETLRQFIADEIVCTAKLHGHQSVSTIQGIADAQAGEIMRRAREAYRFAELVAALNGVMKWWMETPEFEDGEDEMPAEIFDAARNALANANGEA